MSVGSGALLGRDTEVADAVEAITGASGGYVALVGAAGIGKSALLREISERVAATGIAVRSTTGAASEADLPFVGLHDLVGEDVVSGTSYLPDSLREALEVALLITRTAAARADPLALNLAVLKVVEHLSTGRRALLVLDDLPWVDAASRGALAFALRRLPPDRVSLLVAMRPGTDGADIVAPGAARTIAVGPLDVATLVGAVELRTGDKVPHRLARSLHDLSGGNPLLAIELVRTRRLDGDVLAELAVPERYRAILTPRLSALSPDAAWAVLGVSLMSRPTLAELADVVSIGGLVEAEAAGVLRVHDGRVAFSHPLFGALSRDAADAADRRDMHARLSKCAYDEIERARHLGSATLLPDEDVAVQIEDVAERARARAAIAAAAELALLAQRLTPPDDLDRLTSRGCAAAKLFYQTGDLATAARVLRGLLDELEPGPLRARTLGALAEAVGADSAHQTTLLQEALRQPGLDPDSQDELRLARAEILVNLGDLAAARDGMPELEERAEASGRVDLARKCRTHLAYLDLATGTPPSLSPVWKRMEAEASVCALTYEHPDLIRAWEAMSREDHDRALALIHGLSESARAAGNIGLSAIFAVHQAEVELRRGNIRPASTLVDEAYRIMSDGRHDEFLLSYRALVRAWQGRLDEARADATEALAMAQRDHNRPFIVHSLHALGFVELSAGQPALAAQHYERVAAGMAALGWRHPTMVVWHGNAVEAMLGAGRRADAAALADDLSVIAHPFGLASAAAVLGRCRALLLEDAGYLDAAVAALDEPVSLSEPLGIPLEHARTLMARGVVQRRLRQKARSRADLRWAHDLFASQGAAAWAGRAARELERSAGVAAGAGLTTAERTVAERAASGATNREIAASLYLSEKTVEAVLTRVYRKLAVRSRRQLVQHPALVEVSARQPALPDD